jgi:glycosyltransferase involved in cell wall biosynthesis
MSASHGESVLILIENLSFPFDRRVFQEATTLTKAGYDVVVICPMGAGRDDEKFAEIEGVEVHRFPLRAVECGAHGYPREYALALWHTRRLIGRLARTRDFSVVHACNPPDFLLLTALSLRRNGAAFIFDHHDLVPELYMSRFGHGEDLGYKLVRSVERVALRLADVVISTNESYRRAVMERGGVELANSFVVRSAPDLKRFCAVEQVPELRRGKPHLLAYLGVMGPQDGVDHALYALAALRDRRQDWHAIFVGSGDVFHAMQGLCAELALQDLVEFTGRIPNESLRQVLSTADVGLAPDPKNPLNEVSTMNKILEYMACGLPTASYDLLEARVSADNAAVYAEPNNPVALADKIADLLDAPERRQRMAQLGKDRIAGEFGWHHSEVMLLRAYERALELRFERASAREQARRPFWAGAAVIPPLKSRHWRCRPRASEPRTSLQLVRERSCLGSSTGPRSWLR